MNKNYDPFYEKERLMDAQALGFVRLLDGHVHELTQQTCDEGQMPPHASADSRFCIVTR